jgi:MFS family permease
MTDYVRRLGAETFASLSVRNYRLYFSGQAISGAGTWMQVVAQSWLVLQLTHSGTLLGAVVAVQLLPVLLLSPYAGVIVDRVNKRRMLFGAQITSGALSLTLGLLTITGAVTLWMVFVLAAGLGLVRAFVAPGQQSFASELVGRDLLRNAVSLNNVMLNAARAVGPALAGILIASVGVGICFLVNAASFVAVLLALWMMDAGALATAPPVERAKGQVREGLRYARGEAELFVPLLMMALVGTLAYEFQVVLPLMASGPLHGGASAYGFMTSAMGAGAVVGGLVIARRMKVGLRSLTLLALVFSATITAVALAPSLPFALAALLVMGAASTSFLSTSASSLQLASRPSFRGRVMSLWSLAFLGSTPIGGPIIGAISQQSSPRVGMLIGALACLVCAGLGASVLARRRTRDAALPDSNPALGDRPATTDCDLPARGQRPAPARLRSIPEIDRGALVEAA